MTKIKALIIFLSLLVVGLSASLTVVLVKNANNNSNEVVDNDNKDKDSTSAKEDVYYTITFVDYDDSKLDEISVKEGVKPSYTKAIPTRTDEDNSIYRFIGWDSEIVEANSNKTYKAVYLKNDYYVVSFDTNNGSKAPNSQIIKNNNCAIEPVEPTREHYIFNGWFNGNELWNFENKVEEDIVLKAKWVTKQYSVTATNSNSELGVCSNIVDEKYNYGYSVRLTATPNPDYEFLGWFEGDKLISSNSTYNLMVTKDITLEGRWGNYTLTTKVNNSNAGTITAYNESIIKSGRAVNLTMITNPGYTYLGLYNGEELLTNELSYRLTMPKENTTLEAKWEPNNYNFVVSNSDSELGTISGDESGTYKCGDEITIVATPIGNNLFAGWFDGTTIVSWDSEYTFSMTPNDLNLSAKWSTYTLTTSVNDVNAGTITSMNNTPVAPGEVLEIQMETNPGYTFIGLFDGDTQLTTDLTYQLTMPEENVILMAKWSHVTTTTNLPFAGALSDLTGKYKVNDYVLIKVFVTYDGYQFDGWYEDGVKKSSSLNYGITMTEDNVTYEARFTANNYALSIDNNTELEVQGTGTYPAGTKVSLKAINVPEGKTILWKNGDDALSVGEEYLYTISGNDVTISATLIDDEEIIKVGNTIFMGSYPQTLVMDNDINTELSALAGELPTSDSSNSWTDYGYYIDNVVTSYMWYQDVTFNGNKYRGIYFIEYRHRDLTNSSRDYSSDFAYQNQRSNGYFVNTTYWFKFEPIRWNILDTEGSKYFIVSDLLLDSQEFSTNNNRTFNTSDIKNWLNDNFYNIAFENSQKSRIIDTTLADSNDAIVKMFLLSFGELNDYYPTTNVRLGYGTDYARSQGLCFSKTNSYKGTSYWLLRNGIVSNTGTTGSGTKYYTDDGVRPACWIYSLIAPYTVNHYKQNIDNDEYTPSDTDNLEGKIGQLTNATAKNYEGFTSPEIAQVVINSDGTTSVELYYTRNSYELTLQNSDTSMGSITGLSGTYKYGKSITLLAEPASGCVFLGWYNNSGLVSDDDNYTFDMPNSSLALEARWSLPLTAYTVEHYKQNVDNDEYTLADTDNLKGVAGESTNAVLKNYVGFTLPELVQTTIADGGTTVMKLYYTRNSYTFSTIRNDESAGTITDVSGTYKYDKSITLAGTTTAGYVFVGWYHNNALLSDELNDTIKMPAYDLDLEARWIKVSIARNLPFAGATNELSSTYKAGQSTYVEVLTTNHGYTFIGWYEGENLLTTNKRYNFNMPSENKTFEARWTVEQYKLTINNETAVTINKDKEGTIIGTDGPYYDCDEIVKLSATNVPNDKNVIWYEGDKILGIGDEYLLRIKNDITITIELGDKSTNNVTIIGNNVFFGTYPQSLVGDNTLITDLNTKAGELPNPGNLHGWTDYNYYVNNEVTSFMYYQDIDYDNDGTLDYRGIYFTRYRNRNSISNQEGNGNPLSYHNQLTNGYLINTVYWFKFEPIKWDIISTDGNKIFMVADLLLDSQRYSPNNISYGYSEIRTWLNETFYNTAFSSTEKAMINGTNIGSNVTDKIFLLSNTEASQYFDSNTLRYAQGTDYAKSQGLYVSTDEGYIGNSYWWLRNYMVTHTGSTNSSSTQYYIDDGIRPACWITIE